MAALVKILKDGSETGATSADKINLSFDKVDAALKKAREIILKIKDV